MGFICQCVCLPDRDKGFFKVKSTLLSNLYTFGDYKLVEIIFFAYKVIFTIDLGLPTLYKIDFSKGLWSGIMVLILHFNLNYSLLQFC